jgi:hypothetical protein
MNPHPARNPSAKVILVVGLWVSCLLGACGPQDAFEDSLEGDEVLAVDEAGIYSGSGSLSASGTSWAVHSFSATAGEQIKVQLDWANASADLNVFLYNPSGTLVIGSNGLAKPETLSFKANVTGKWKVGIKCKKGSTTYKLSVSMGTVTDPTSPPPTEPTPTPTPTKKALLGMSAPTSTWDQRVKEVGPGLQARRIFYQDFGAGLSLAEEACRDGMYPVLSFKTGSYSWSQVASGAADSALRTLAGRLAALPCPVFAAIHHEPAKDGAASDWAAMQVHALPILGVDADVSVGVIGNGWWWSAASQGYSDAEIAEYITPGVIRVSDVIASDTYQDNPDSEESAPKMRRMGEWARRVGGVKALGIGEFNGPTASNIKNALAALAADPLFAWGCLWNSYGGVATVLTGVRLVVFREGLAAW